MFVDDDSAKHHYMGRWLCSDFKKNQKIISRFRAGKNDEFEANLVFGFEDDKSDREEDEDP